MKIGDYVRYSDGTIEQITRLSINEENPLFRTIINSTPRITPIVKSSPNLIDLIEVGDYVNGCYVSNKRASVNEHLGGHPKGIGIIKCNAYFNQGNYNDCKFVWIEENAIESIVTKEQYERAVYRV